MKRTAYRYASLVVSLTCTFAAMGGGLLSAEAGFGASQRPLVNGHLLTEINASLRSSHWSFLNSHLAALQQDSVLLNSKEKISTNFTSLPDQPFTNDLLTIDQKKNFSLIIPSLTPAFTSLSGAGIDHVKSYRSYKPPSTSYQLQNDSTPLPPETIKRRTTIIATTNVVGYSLGMVWLYNAWYKNYPQSKFHSFNDIGEWKGMDKLGHAYSAYAESKASMELWRWTGIDRKKRIWLGGMSGAFYQTVIEVLDGFSAEWGWSWADFTANIAGSGLLVAQELAWDEQRVQMKWSFHRKQYADPTLNQRSNQLFGRSSAERFLKDYNGQTYWLSTSLKPFFPGSNLPAWLQVSVGTGVEGLFGGYENIGKDADGNTSFNRPDIARRRQWYLAPDVDLTKIKTNKKGIRLALQVLNIVKFPTPSLEYSRGKFGWNWVHF